jgi:hypothetical protein
MSIEVMRQALEALDSDSPDIQLLAATALRAAMEQPWVKTYSGGKPNYTVPIERQWVGLNDQQVLDLADEHLYGGENYRILDFYKAIEAKLKEKNT